MVQKEVKKKTSIYGIVAVLSAIVLVSLVYVLGSAPLIFPSAQNPTIGGMKTFGSNQDIVNFLNTNSRGNNQYGGGPLDNKFFGRSPVPTSVPAPVSQSTGSIGTTSSYNEPQQYWAQSDTGHSTTNIQVSGVDEADTVKTDGSYIYTTSSTQPSYYYYGNSASDANSVYILNADPSNAKVESKIVLGNDTEPAGLYLSQDGNRLVVLASKYQLYSYAYGISNSRGMMPMLPAYQSNVYTYIDVYDVSNKANPVLTRNFTVSGSYFNSRMIGNNVYAVVSQPAMVYNNTVTLPTVYMGQNGGAVASPSSIYYADTNDTSYTFTSFYGFNLLDDAVQPTNLTVMMGGASTMYVSTNNIYVTYPDWDHTVGPYTSIYRVAINGLQLSFEAQGSVPGDIINQYAMDEYNGYFRVATNWAAETKINNVYVLDSNLTITGKLEGLAPNENLHSARFMGDKCYLVTFMATDPLFVVDLSQPSNPTLLGELKIPGYSNYLQPYDENHLIGIGKEATEASGGGFAYYQGLKLSLFDVSDVNNPKQLTSYGIGDRGTDSVALSDPKAFLFDKSKGLLVIPVSLALVDNNSQVYPGTVPYGQTVWQGAYVFSLSLDGGFTLRGTITHLSPALLGSDGHLKNPGDYYSTQNQWITRSLYIGNVLYTVSNGEVKLNSLSDLSPIASINLT